VAKVWERPRAEINIIVLPYDPGALSGDPA
jgi:hypothetical protein